jgi:gliding motility-associated lipoprotein GldD
MKADRIIDKQIIDEKRKVYGTFFEFQGNVATNFQFYLTDSINHFVRGEVLMNCRPNYDSLRPSLDYLKQDLIKLFDSFEWKN